MAKVESPPPPITERDIKEIRFALACGSVVFKDGNSWCCLYGKDLQVGISGFGLSPLEAVYEHNMRWRKKE